MKQIFRSIKQPVSVRLTLAALPVVIALVLISLAGSASAQVIPVPPLPVQLDMHTIASPVPGVNLSLREKHIAGSANFSSDRVILLLEPFGVPAAESFDANGYSLMDYLAQQGYDVWALDFRSFGASDRTAAFAQYPMANPPQVTAAEAVYDVDAAMEYIFSQRGVSKSHLLGWSWGGVVAADYASLHPEKLERLVVYGGMHAFLLPSMTGPMTNPNTGQRVNLPAYRLDQPSMSIGHWNMQAMGEVPHTAAAEAELSRIFINSDPTAFTRSPATIRRPMGPMADLYEIWSGRPIFDASLITAPTLIIRGDHDTFSDDPGFMDALTNARTKRYVEIPMATHWALYEDGPSQTLMNEIGRFLSSGRPQLSLRLAGNRWATYADYTERRLSVDYTVENSGENAGFNLTINGSTGTLGVSLDPTSLLAPLGDILSGSGKSFTLKYTVPAGVASFRATVQASVEDGGGLVYQYPAPLI